MDATAWGAIGGGLSALSEGLTAMQLRKLAKQREDEERERQKEEAALRKAQLKAQEFQSMDARNFKKVTEGGQVTNKANANVLLNAAAFGRGGEQVKGDISGDTYFRGAGESPNDQARAAKEAQIQNALDKITLSKQYDEQIARLKAQAALDQKAMVGGDTRFTQDRIDGRYDRTPDAVKTTEAGKDRRFNTGEAGKDRRQENSKTGTSAKPPTESQAKAATFSGLMEAAESELNKNPWGSKPMGAMTEIAIKGDGGGLAANAAAALARTRMTPEQQRAMQSRFQFTQAALYAFSGQSAPNSEVAKNIAIFFPQSGETDPTLIEQKKRMRATATMLLAKRKSGLVDGAVPVAPDAVGGGSGLSNLNSMARP